MAFAYAQTLQNQAWCWYCCRSQDLTGAADILEPLFSNRSKSELGTLFSNRFQMSPAPQLAASDVSLSSLSFSFTGMTQFPFSGTANLRFVFTTSSSFFLMSQGPQRRQLHLCSLSKLCVPLKSMSAAGVEGEILGLNFTIIYKYTGPSDNLRGIFGFLPWSYLAYHGRRKWGI